MITRTGDQLQVSGNLTMATVSALISEGLKPQANSNMVIDFAQRIIGRLPAEIRLFSLKLQETDSSFAEWYASDNL